MHNLPDKASHAWRDLDGEVIFLDLEGDRYFRLRDNQNACMVGEMARGDLSCWHVPAALALPEEWEAASGAWCSGDEQRFSLPDVARALWMQRRTERRLASEAFDAVLHSTRRLLDQASARPCADREAAINRVGHAFDRARLLRTAADRCLARSLACALMLAGHGIRATVVIGVRRSPFGAHCWAQSGSLIINDTWDETQRFTPLLVV
ncbi:lasso peptide biosynthesis B2 protein [Porphyrobacter sp. YT40]|uniref:lasso peptide biosynthesis B2 protein n=1 Tax=Porphyrobacter sp. YT40 TaxID=2547601 RepID=UPI001144FB91|nr:lasso peptide biosynthesis B2 protein [Porphyrobacter sp. YT40]QDH33833.1 lasso peptide biosynthesis B2 protein [Porphyrobacter sp. YT40]